jgi:hypothetical protein
MRWVRRRQRFGSYLALAGLALQLVLSFGHIHLDGISGDRPTLVVGTNASLPLQSPAQHPANDADDYCPICATIHLAGTLFLPEPPQLPLTFVSQPIEHFNHIAVVFVASQRAPFQSRAPPLA